MPTKTDPKVPNSLHPMKNRHAASLFVVIACLTVVTMILLSTVTESIRHRRQVRTEIQLEQTSWLLDAGIGKAISMYNQDAKFERTVYSVDESFSKYQGELAIEIVNVTSEAAHIQITARLQGLQKYSQETKRTRTIVINLATNSTQTNEE